MLQIRKGFKKKKFLVSISLFLTLMMLIGSISPVYATDGEGQQEETTLVDSQNTPTPTEEGALDDGEYFVEGEDETDGDVHITVDTTDPTAEPEVTPEITPEITPEVTPEITPEVTEEPVEEELQYVEKEYTLDDVAFEEKKVSLVVLPVCNIEEHAHTEDCYKDGELICGIHEHTHNDDCYKEGSNPFAFHSELGVAGASTIIAAFKSIINNSVPINPMLPRIHIERKDLVDHDDNASNHTYIEIGTEHFDLGVDREMTIPEVADKAPVRLCLVIKIPTNLLGNQELYYNLPKEVSWEPASGSIFYSGWPDEVGDYKIANNRVSLVFDPTFLKNNSRIVARIYVDGNIDARITTDTPEEPFKFDDIGEIEIKKINRDAKVLTVRKNAAKGLSYTDPEDESKNIPFFIEDAGDGKIKVWYQVYLTTTNGEIKDIDFHDKSELPDLETNRIQDAVYDRSSFRLGTAFGANDWRTGFIVEDQETGTTTNLLNVPNFNPGVNPTFSNGNKAFNLKINSFDSTDENKRLYLTYAVIITPKTEVPNYDDTDGKTTTLLGALKNEINATGSDETTAKTTDEFNYAERPVDKAKGSKPKDSYSASWTATFNEMGDLTGYVGKGQTTTIADTLKKGGYAKEGTEQPVDVVPGDAVSGGIKYSESTLDDDKKQAQKWTLDNKQYFYDAEAGTWMEVDMEAVCQIPLVKEDETDPAKKYQGFSIVMYTLNENNLLTRVTDQAKIFETMKTTTGGDITSIEDFYNNFFKSEPIPGHASHVADWNGQGIVVPKNNKYVITYQSHVHPEDQVNAPIGEDSVTLTNEASDGDNSSGGGPSDSSDIGVGPAQPTTEKNYIKATGIDGGSTGYADWVISVEIADEKAQLDGNLIYDYLEPGHVIVTDMEPNGTPIYFFKEKKEKKDEYTPETADAEISWSNSSIVRELLHKETKDGVPEEPTYKDGDDNTGKYNFSFDLGNALESAGGSLVDGGLPKGTYTIRFRTKLTIAPDGPIDGANFKYTNHTYSKLKGQDKWIHGTHFTARNIVEKADLDRNIELYKRATGDDLSGKGYQEIPWFVSSLVLVDEMVIVDSFSLVSTGANYGEMTLVNGSLKIFETTATLEDLQKSDFDWSTVKPVSSDKYTVSSLNGNASEGFEVRFKSGALDTQTGGNRVAMFYLTSATDDTIQNLKRLRYSNKVTPEINPGGDNPEVTDETTRDYDILDKEAQFNVDDPERIATYTINVNKSQLDLDHSKDIVTVTDELDEYLDFIAGSFHFYKLTLNSSGQIIDKELMDGQPGYTLDASEPHKLIITVPDQTPVQLEYQAKVTYQAEVNGDKKLINTAEVNGFKKFSSSSTIVVTVVKHRAEITADNFNIRLYKYDENEPTKPLPGAQFLVTMYSVVFKDGKKELELHADDLSRHPTNPYSMVTDENGEFVFHGKYDVVYKIEEIQPPEGYIRSNLVEYFVHVGNYDEEYFSNISDEYGNLINPTIYHIYEDMDEIRYTISNKKASTALKLIKKNGAGSEVLTGASFRLKKANGEVIHEKIETNASGEILFDDLTEGTYILEELQAPKGYKRQTSAVQFTYDGVYTYVFGGYKFIEYIPSDDPYKPNRVIFKNYFYDVWVPDTSDQTDIGMWSILLAGSFLLTILLVWLLNQDNKQLD